MNIQYYGHSCFKLVTRPNGRNTGEVVVFLDPFDKYIGLKPPQGKADVVFISHTHHNDHNNAKALKGDPIVIDTPGEFSIKGTSVAGIDSWHDESEGAERGRNTIFVLETEEIKICHLGDLGQELTTKQLEKLSQIDILMIPVGGKYTLDSKRASNLVKKMEPKIIIPMHYKLAGTKLDIEDEKGFCSEMGTCPKEKVNKLSIKKKDLEDKNMEIILMKV